MKLIEFKGIGYEEGCDPETIGHNTVKFIKNHIDIINRNNRDSYNDYVHCIWYCVTDSRFEDDEKVVLRKLKSSYKDNNLPIVLVYTQAEDIEMADKMGNYIDGIEEKTVFVKILAEDVELPNNGRLPSFGKEDLLNITLKKCTEALGGNMINIMIKKISNDIKRIMLDININNEKTLNSLVIDQFINKYNEVLKDEEFMNYIICMLGRNLEKLIYDKRIFNSSLNLLIQSDIIRNIKSFISFYKKSTKEFNKRQLKSIPLKERKQVYKQLEYDKLLEKEKKDFLKNIHIPYIDRRIKECLKKGLSNIEIFDIVKLNEGPHSQEFNKLLEDYISEQALIHQLSIMPSYFITIIDSLKELILPFCNLQSIHQSLYK